MNVDLMQGASVGAKATMSESGWSNTDVFKDYMENHFLKYVHRTDATQPVLLLFDGHTTHTSPEMIRWARERHIHMFVLPAHTSHLLQPLDNILKEKSLASFSHPDQADHGKQRHAKTVASRRFFDVTGLWPVGR